MLPLTVPDDDDDDDDNDDNIQKKTDLTVLFLMYVIVYGMLTDLLHCFPVKIYVIQAALELYLVFFLLPQRFIPSPEICAFNICKLSIDINDYVWKTKYYGNQENSYLNKI